MDIEDIFFATEACLPLSMEIREFYKCYPDDFEVTQKISEALLSLELEHRQFIFFDMMISEQEKHYLELIETHLIDDYNININGNLNELHDIMAFFILDDLPKKFPSYVKNVIANLVIKLTSLIVAESGYEDAGVLIMTDTNKEKPFIDRHIDKTHAEMTNLKISDELKQQAFLLPLIGEATKFFSITPEQRSEFNKLTHETFSTWGQYGSPYQDQINAIFNATQEHSPPPGFASTHFAGYNGTLHAKPYTHGKRLIIKVVPNDSNSLEEFDQTIRKG